jgi:hypothetical protein
VENEELKQKKFAWKNVKNENLKIFLRNRNFEIFNFLILKFLKNKI